MFDHRPAAAEMARLVNGVRDDQLGDPTPCPDYTLGDLLEHVHGLSLAFALAARKEQRRRRTARRAAPRAGCPGTGGPRSPSGSTTWWSPGPSRRVAGPGHRGRCRHDAARRPRWSRSTSWSCTAGTSPGPAGRTTGPTPPSLAGTEQFVSAFSGPEMAQARQGLFGPVVPSPTRRPRSTG